MKRLSNTSLSRKVLKMLHFWYNLEYWYPAIPDVSNNQYTCISKTFKERDEEL